MGSSPPFFVGPAPVRQPMFDPRGNLTAPWLIWFQKLFVAGTTLADLTGSGWLSGFDDGNPINYGPAIEDAQNLARETPRVYDDSGLRSLIAGANAPHVYDDSELRSAIAALGTQRLWRDEIDELRSQIAALAAPNLNFQQQIDELRALLTMNDVPQLSNFFAAGGFLLATNNLSDVASESTALSNLMGSWGTWTPTVTASGSMTISSLSVKLAAYLQVGPITLFNVWVQATLGGTASTSVNVSLPTALVGAQNICAAELFSGSWQLGFGTVVGGAPNTIELELTSLGNFTLGSFVAEMSGFYRST